MKYHFKLLPILFLGACSNMHNQDMIIEKSAYMMSRQEVITAIEDCKSANLDLFYFMVVEKLWINLYHLL